MDHTARTSIIATLGPASFDASVLEKMVAAGASILRINGSHGTTGQHESMVAMVRALEDQLGRPLAILLDLPGPKVRVGEMDFGPVVVERGGRVLLDGRSPQCRLEDDGTVVLAVTYPQIVGDLTPADRVVIADGVVQLQAVESSGDTCLCEVRVGGEIDQGKGINLPDSELDIPAMGDRDRKLVAWAVASGIDFIGLSFVQREEDVVELRSWIDFCKDDGAIGPGVIAKFETQQAMNHAIEIVMAADAIMVARGDLGVQINLASVPVAQRELLSLSAQAARPAIVATQVLESMVKHPVPTRAEAGDIATAVRDGADALMLSAETAIGDHPVTAIAAMDEIASVAESAFTQRMAIPDMSEHLEPWERELASIGHGVIEIAQGLGARGVIFWTVQGRGPRLASRYPTHLDLVAMTDSLAVARRLLLLRGVRPLMIAAPPTPRDLLGVVDEVVAPAMGYAQGDRCLVVAAAPLGASGKLNRIMIHEVGTGIGAIPPLV
jgi:pyruvate kinase